MGCRDRKTALRRFGPHILVAWLLCVAVSSAVAESPSQSASTMQLQRILLDQALWGPDAMALLGALKSWKGLTSSVVIFSDHATSGNRYESNDSAQKSLRALSSAFRAPPSRLRVDYETEYQRYLSRVASFQIRVERLLEDDALHIVVLREGGEFLKPGIEMRTIVERYGKPEKTTTEVVHALGDRRPAILTLHSYGGGAVTFVLSDIAPNVAAVDRVVIEVDPVVAQIH